MIPAACQPTSPPASAKKRPPEEGNNNSMVVNLSPAEPCPHCGVDLGLLASVKQVPIDDEILFREQVQAKKERLDQLQEEISRTKESMQDLVEMKNLLAGLWGKVLSRRLKVNIATRACREKEQLLQTELDTLRVLDKANARRSEHLKHVRSKNFPEKEESLKTCIEKDREASERSMLCLERYRKSFITDLHRKVFPIEVLPLSHKDEGAEDYQEQTRIDCDQLLELEEGWVLGGVHRHPSPHISIVCPSLPVNGDHTPYLLALRERRKHKGETTAVQLHPTSDPYQSTPAALVYVSQLVEVLAWVLDQPLPFPIHRPEAISEHGFLVKRKKSFLSSMAKLDDNVMYLCFTQGVPLTALAVGHTLQNVLALVTHVKLGRSGSFESYPELMSHASSSASRPTSRASKLSSDVDDSQPPNITYAADSHGYQGEESESDEWEEEEALMQNMPTIDDGEWEDLELSPAEALLFEEERRAALRLQQQAKGKEASTEMYDYSAPSERRAWRLDYDSTYADFKALAIMSSGRKSQASFASGSGLLDSHKAETAAKVEQKVEAAAGEAPAGVATSLFGTLSNLWSSTFGGR